MPVYTTNFDELLEPGLRKIYGLAYGEWPTEYDKCFTMNTSKKASEYDLGMTGLGTMPTKPEGQPITYDTAYQGYKQTYTHTTRALGFQVTREMYEDDLYREIAKLPKELARSARETVEIITANHLNNAFSNTYTGSDGLELCSTLHTTVAAGTYRNELSVAADLDATSLEQALIDIGTQFINDRGLKMAARPMKLIIHPANVWTAEKLLKSTLDPESAYNAVNPGKSSIPQGYMPMHYLTDADAWFILTDVPNGLNFFWRRRPEFATDNDFDSENAKYKATMRFSSGWTDPRGIFGSPGA
jgi:phage major head subunit gpT-like protein